MMLATTVSVGAQSPPARYGRCVMRSDRENRIGTINGRCNAAHHTIPTGPARSAWRLIQTELRAPEWQRPRTIEGEHHGLRRRM